MKKLLDKPKPKAPLIIAALYLASGILWILFSDQAVNALISNPEARAWAQMIKGWIYVFLTALLLFLLIRRDVSQRERDKQLLYQGLKEQKLLVKEVHHRVKNNLQIIISLLNLQGGTLKAREAVDALEQAKNRIYAMAAVHERAYGRREIRPVDPAALISGIADHRGHHRDLDTWDEPLPEINLETAVPLALAVNEIFSRPGIERIGMIGKASPQGYDITIILKVKPPAAKSSLEDHHLLINILTEQISVGWEFLEGIEPVAPWDGDSIFQGYRLLLPGLFTQ